MNRYKKIETKLRNEINILTSGVLTSLIYGLLSESSYELVWEGKHYTITSNGMSLWHALGLVVVTFLGLLAFISLFIPWMLKVRKRFVYASIKKVTARDLVEMIDETKLTIEELYPIFDSQNKDMQIQHIQKLHSRDLARTILRLHKKFLPQNKHIRDTIKKHFRNYNHSSIITIDRKISVYEFSSIISILKSMVSQLKLGSGDDLLLKKDCTEMENAIHDMEKLIFVLKSNKTNG